MTEYIDRELVHKAINDNQYSEWFYDGLPSRVDRSISIGAASCAINNIPVADVAPVVHAKWERGYSFPDGEYWKCSHCNELIKVKIPMHYCNNCGAKMDKE